MDDLCRHGAQQSTVMTEFPREGEPIETEFQGSISMPLAGLEPNLQRGEPEEHEKPQLARVVAGLIGIGEEPEFLGQPPLLGPGGFL
ncbi:hypothetical protein SAMN05444354_106347 [Stigmatella aurantiaca]|uniref:Uncharacterized protein n=1 Tax=Stigmatella aurantiaca TaxID=41 RepID=A0A1H7R1E1_STIAU|nr:hypothetical protein SAMN05444354_106347 [Stigmatella aurantiaca]